MHPYALIPLFAGVAATAIASAILARDPAHRANRLVAAILGCAAYWSFLEVIWNSQDDPRWVPWLIRISSLGWVPLGPLCIHLFVELLGDAHARLRRGLPAIYATAGAGILLYIATPWCITGVVPTSWGWGITFGPLFLVVYLPTATCALGALAVLWRRAYPREAPPSERRQGYWAFAAIAVPLLTASTTDAFLPLFGMQVPRLGSASMVFFGVAVAWSVHYYGYSLIVPSSFAAEILATLRDGVALLRQDGVIRTGNGGLARLVECRPENLIGTHISESLPALPHDAMPEINDLECELIQRTGRSVPVSIASARLRDRQGNVGGLVVVVRDLREVVDLRSRLLRSGRMAAVGELAAGIAHEINNPIAFVQANLKLLQEHWIAVEKHATHESDLHDIAQEGTELIEESLEGVERVAAIVRDIRGFSHAGGGERELANLNDLLETTLRMAAPQFGPRAVLERGYAEIPPVSCNPQELKQVFLNMVMNALHAIAESGTIRVATELDGADVIARIEDDGCGIPPDLIDRIYDPFFTTKRVGEGTGLGLALSYQIVRKHGGEIHVESEPNRGTAFRIELPAVWEGDEDRW